MKLFKLILISTCFYLVTACQNPPIDPIEKMTKSPNTIKIATFNVSMEATNYIEDGDSILSSSTLSQALKSGKQEQINNIAEIIQRVRPDILLLNEFDYIENPDDGIRLFMHRYLEVPQNGQSPIKYPYVYLAPVNTGIETPINDDSARLTHYGFGRYPGQYGMLLLSMYPIVEGQIRTFQHFLWKDMPANLMPEEAGSSWYQEREVEIMRLSSKSHWDIPVNICGQYLNILASHPTPPVFDGPEDRNGRRNHDEIRFWKDYIQGDKNSYHYDDNGVTGGIVLDRPFVILGDLNASDVDGDAYPGAIKQLLESEQVNHYAAPRSEGGKLNMPDSEHADNHTAAWGMRADYVLPSMDLSVIESGVFWPKPDEDTARLVADRSASSDHRMVWVVVDFPATDIVCDSSSRP